MVQDVKQALLKAMSRHVLTHGLNAASLRPLAKAAGTSDRMLIYYFSSKDQLIGELLAFIADEMAQELARQFVDERATSVGGALRALVSLIRSPQYRPYMRLWLDIVSSAGYDNRSHREAGHGIAAGFHDWVVQRLPLDEPTPHRSAALVLTLIEGLIVMDAVGQPEIADQAVESLLDILGTKA
jgi:AcrR family transcriptional regulator